MKPWPCDPSKTSNSNGTKEVAGVKCMHTYLADDGWRKHWGLIGTRWQTGAAVVWGHELRQLQRQAPALNTVCLTNREKGTRFRVT